MKTKEFNSNEVQHFTEAPDIQHFATVKTNKNDNVYGIVWAEVVREYLKTAYSLENPEAEVISDGITYKILKRKDVTAFYDAEGSTLFDVENSRLEKEYGYVMQEENSKKDVRADNAESHDSVFIKQRAREKYERSLIACKLHEKGYFEGPVKEHMLNRFEEDTGFCEDFLQEHKTFQKCINYMLDKAKAFVPKSESYAMVEGSVFLEWMEDYFRRDDKAEEEKKAKEAAGRKKKEEECKNKADEQKKTDKKKPKQADKKTDKVEENPTEPLKSRKNPKEMDGQMDLFSLMGM